MNKDLEILFNNFEKSLTDEEIKELRSSVHKKIMVLSQLVKNADAETLRILNKQLDKFLNY